jgi:hypothetical protein
MSPSIAAEMPLVVVENVRSEVVEENGCRWPS